MDVPYKRKRLLKSIVLTYYKKALAKGFRKISQIAQAQKHKNNNKRLGFIIIEKLMKKKIYQNFTNIKLFKKESLKTNYGAKIL